MGWDKLLFVVLGGLFVWMGYGMYKRGSLGFSKENGSKTLTTLGCLALMLLLVIVVAISYLKASS